jgi:hypothetical protein
LSVHNPSQKARLAVKQYLRRSPDRGRRDGEAFGVAGIWENWRDPFTSKWERTFYNPSSSALIGRRDS